MSAEHKAPRKFNELPYHPQPQASDPVRAEIASPSVSPSGAQEWLSQFEPARPSSAGLFDEKAQWSTGFEDLFTEVVPPVRPVTPGPDACFSSGLPAPTPSRRNSEAAAIDRIFSQMHLSSSPPSAPLGVPPVVAESPLHQRPLDVDEAFKGDLSNVLVWFQNDLSNSQRITTAFTLLNHLTTWQLRFVLSLLSKPSEDYEAEIRGLAEDAPPGLASAPPSTPAPSPSAMPPTHTPPPSARTSPGPAELTLDQCNVGLFRRDISAWLRSLRLHKYSNCFAGLKPDELLSMATGSTADAQLEARGVAALGARRKLIRVLLTIASS